jgi:hypothetical protein
MKSHISSRVQLIFHFTHSMMKNRLHFGNCPGRTCCHRIELPHTLPACHIPEWNGFTGPIPRYIMGFKWMGNGWAVGSL